MEEYSEQEEQELFRDYYLSRGDRMPFLGEEIERYQAIEEAATNLFSSEWGKLDGTCRPLDNEPLWQALHDALMGQKKSTNPVVVQTAEVVTGTMIGMKIDRIG